MSTQTILKAVIDGRAYELHVEQSTYNGWPAYYLVDETVSALFDGHIPDNLIMFETDTGVQFSPRIVTLKGREIAQELWKAIRSGSNELTVTKKE